MLTPLASRICGHLRFADAFRSQPSQSFSRRHRVTSLDLALVGNGRLSALIDRDASVVWSCFPRFDGDPVFCSLLAGEDPEQRPGNFSIRLEGGVRYEQSYL